MSIQRLASVGREEMSAFPILQAAIWQATASELSHLDGTNVQRLVNPLGLVAKEVSGTWGICGSGGAFRISRTDACGLLSSSGRIQLGDWQRSMVEFTANLPLCGNACCPRGLGLLCGHFARLINQSTGCRGLDSVSIRFDVKRRALCAGVWRTDGGGGAVRIAWSCFAAARRSLSILNAKLSRRVHVTLN